MESQDITITLPTAIDLEARILGKLILRPGLFNNIASIAHKDLFYDKEHKAIFSLMSELHNKKGSYTIDELTYKIEDVSRGTLREVQLDGSFLTKVFEGILILKQFYVRRLIFQTSNYIFKKSTDPSKDEFDLADDLRNLYDKISKELYLEDESSIKDQIKATLSTMEEANKTDSSITGVRSGFLKIDELTAGFQKGELTILAARPSTGKSTWALNMFQNCLHNNISGAFFSLEMKYEQLWQKMFSAATGIKHKDIRRGTIGKKEWLRINDYITNVLEKRMFIYDKGRLGANQFKVMARNLKASEDIQFIIVDYLQLMNTTDVNERISSREQQVSVVSRTLKEVAMELNIPVIALAQLSRKIEERRNKVPILSDLRESGSLEQDADVVGFLHRPEMYAEVEDDEKGLTEFIIAKQRNDAIGRAIIYFDKDISKFKNKADEITENTLPF